MTAIEHLTTWTDFTIEPNSRVGANGAGMAASRTARPKPIPGIGGDFARPKPIRRSLQSRATEANPEAGGDFGGLVRVPAWSRNRATEANFGGVAGAAEIRNRTIEANLVHVDGIS
jgi:hypothetical protein